MTLFYGVLEPKSGEFVYVNAGHPPSYFFKCQTDLPLNLLHRTGMPLGVYKGESWGKETIKISQGDGLLLYTDGVTEGMNGQGMLYGENRLTKVIKEAACTSAAAICSTVLQDLESFVGPEAQSDDIAMIAIKRDML